MPQTVPSLTSPLNLRQFLRPADSRLDPVPFLDLLLIGLFFALFNSQFILPQGLDIELPQAGREVVTGTPVAAVVTLLPPPPSESGALGLVLFEGDIIRQEQLRGALRQFLQATRNRDDRAVLLVKMDRRASLAQLTAVAEAARAAGFTAVQIAAEERPDLEGDIQP